MMKIFIIVLFCLLFIAPIAPVFAEENGEYEPPLDYVETDTPPSAPTNRSHVLLLLDNFKDAIQQKDTAKYLSCFSKSFSKEVVEVNQYFTNRYYLTYTDIEAGMKKENFSKYNGYSLVVNYVFKNVQFDYMEADVSLDIIIQMYGSGAKTEKEPHKFRLLWDEDLKKWEIVSF